MIVAESQSSRRIVASLDRGADLLEALGAVCRERAVRSGLVAAHGVLEEVELSVHDPRSPGRPAARRIGPAMTIVHLGGPVSERDGQLHVEATCALSREGESGVIVVGGTLRSARVVAATLVIDAFDDLLLRTAADPTSGASMVVAAIAAPRPAASSPPARPGPAPAPAPPPKPAVLFEARATGHVVPRATGASPAPPPRPAPAPGDAGTTSGPTDGSPGGAPTGSTGGSTAASGTPSTTWAEVAAASARRGPVDEGGGAGDEGGDGDDTLRSGDIIEHPRFGRCEVERLEGAGEYVQVRLRNRRLVRLSLDVLQLRRDGRDESGGRRFRARVST